MIKKQSKNDWLWEFSKKVVRVGINLWIVWNFYIMVTMLVTWDFSNVAVIYPEVTNFTGNLLTGYLFKAALENVFKIRNKPEG